MLDGTCAVVAGYVAWCRRLPKDGIPLMLASLAALWYGACLPAATYVHGWPHPADVLKMALVADVLQTAVHAATHRGLLGKAAYASHMVHHRARRPRPVDAFVTGTADALLQLVLPVAASIFAVAPNRTSLVVFGVAYSQWLLFLHSPARLPRCLRGVLVEPRCHAAHHASPNAHFANVFAFLDVF